MSTTAPPIGGPPDLSETPAPVGKSRPAPVTPRRDSTPATPTAAKRRTLQTAKVTASNVGHRIGGYGPGGVGKTTLFASMPGPVAFIDLDESLARLMPKLKEWGLLDNIVAVQGVATWQELRETLNGDGWDSVKSIVIDTATKAEELATAFVLANKKTDRNTDAASIEDYGYGKGYQHLYDEFVKLLGDLDAHARAGRNVVLICHDCNSPVPNPMGPDWIRYEPRLQTSASGKNSIRLRVKEWVDHLLFIGYDVEVSKDGKSKGGGSVTVYPRERPHFMAKSRTLVESMPMDENCYVNLWTKML